MTTPDQLTAFRAMLDDITLDPIDKLVHNPNWGSLNFENARPYLTVAFGIAHQLKNLPIEVLPDNEFNALNNPFVAVAQQIVQIRKFSVEQANPTQIRNGIVEGLKNASVDLYVIAQARLPFLAFQRGDIRRNEEAFAKAVHESQSLLAKALEDTSAKREEIDRIITAAREASASVGVATFTSDFSGTATNLDGAANVWLRWTSGFGLATIAAAVAFPFAFPITGPNFDLNAIQVFTSKLVTLGALSAATYWCGRMYKATKHQAAVNLHRANALKTFQAFVKASSDDPTRDAVLMETTRSIFALTATGYLDGPDSGGDNALKILEVVKTATGK